MSADPQKHSHQFSASEIVPRHAASAPELRHSQLPPEPSRMKRVVGSEIHTRNVSLRVIGILASKGQSITGQDQDDFVVLPFSTAERRVFGTKFLGTVGIILVATVTRDDIPAAAEDIKELLRARHRLHSSEEDDFTIRTIEDIAKTIAGTSRTMMVMLMSIASISLIVGASAS